MGKLLAVVVVSLGLAACRAGSDTSSGPTTSTTDPAAGVTEEAAAASAEEAVIALLGAEQKGDHRASYRLLSAPGRRTLDAGAWARQRNQLPAITGFRVEKSEAMRVIMVVEHEAALDPFLGLTPASERQTWTTRRQGDGWVVDPEPLIEPDFPNPTLAPDAALAWARAVQACNEEAATAQQGVASLFGPVDVAGGLCGSAATLAAGPAEPVSSGPDSQPLVAQYGPEALVWARAVPLTGGNRPFSVVLAPIGSVWKVVAVFAR